MDIKTALVQLDPENGEHWTADGLPRIDAVEGIMGTKGVKRQDITNAAPNFTRDTAAEQKENADAEGHEAEAPEAPPTEAVAGDADPSSEEAQEEAEGDGEAAPEQSAEGDGEAIEAASEPEQPTDPEPEQPVEDAEPSEMERLEAELAEATEEMLDAQRTAEEAKKTADTAANRVNDLNRAIERLQKADPNHGTAGIRKFIDQQNQNRLRRAAGLQRFVEQTGVSPNDVAKAVDPKAPIDRAMSQRKPMRGSLRPNYAR